MSFSHPLHKPIIKGISVSRKSQYEIIEKWKSENVPKLKNERDIPFPALPFPTVDGRANGG